MTTKPLKSLLCALALTPTLVVAESDSKAGYLWSPSGHHVTITAGDDIPDPVAVFPIGVSAPHFSFVITDSESNVLMYTDVNVFDLDGAGAGTCRIYGFAWSGDFDQPTGIPVSELTATGGSSVSRNRITIERVGSSNVDGGLVLNDHNGRGPIRLYLSDQPAPFRVYTANRASTDTGYAYIITDAEGMVLAFPGGNTIDLSGAPPGTCRVFGISYTGTLDTTTGIHVTEVKSDSDNQSLSWNSIRADRFEGSKPTRRSKWRRR